LRVTVGVLGIAFHPVVPQEDRLVLRDRACRASDRIEPAHRTANELGGTLLGCGGHRECPLLVVVRARGLVAAVRVPLAGRMLGTSPLWTEPRDAGPIRTITDIVQNQASNSRTAAPQSGSLRHPTGVCPRHPIRKHGLGSSPRAASRLASSGLASLHRAGCQRPLGNPVGWSCFSGLAATSFPRLVAACSPGGRGLGCQRDQPFSCEGLGDSDPGPDAWRGLGELQPGRGEPERCRPCRSRSLAGHLLLSEPV
jgi:hypothetical protein